MAKNVVVRFLSESAGLEKGFKKAGDAASGFGGRISKLAGSFSSLPGPLGSAASSIGTLGSTAGLAGVAVAGVGAAVGAAVAVAVKSVDAFTDLASQVLSVQRVTGATAEDASRLVAVMDDMEIPVETANKAFVKLAKTVGAGGTALADAGVEVARGASGAVDLSATILNVADAYNATADPARRAALLQAAFGKGADALIPIMEQSRESLEGMFASAEDGGQILDQAQVDKAEEYRLAMDGLSDAVNEVFLTIGPELIPALSDLATLLAVATDKVVDFTKEQDGLVGVFKKVLPVMTGAGLIVKGLSWALGDEVKAAKDAAAAAKEVEDRHAAAADAVLLLQETTTDLTTAMEAVTTAQEKAGRASEKVADAQGKVADATKDLNTLLATGADGLTDYEEALGRVELADRSVADATDAVADAHDDVADAAGKVTDALADVVDAEKDVLDAHEDVEDAAKDVAEAEEKIAEIRKQAAEDAKDAALDIASSQNDVVKANAALVKAEEKLRQLRLGAETTAAGLAEAEQDVADAHLDVDEATRDVEKSTGDLDEATATLAGTSDTAREAEEERRIALDGLNTALATEMTKQAELVEAKDAVVTAENAKTVAVGDLATAEGNLTTKISERNTAQAVAHGLDDTDVKFADTVKDAKDKVAAAERGVRDARREARDATGELKTKVEELKAMEDGLLVTEGNIYGLRDQIIAQSPHLLAAFDASPLGRWIQFLSSMTGSVGGGGVSPLPGFRMVPAAQHGGIVKHRPGGVLVNVGEGRHDEAIVPLEPGGGAGGGVHIGTLNVMKAKATATDVVQELAWAAKTGGI